jgi:hypothetical protein
LFFQQGKRSRDEGTQDSRMQAFLSGVQQSAPSSSVTSQTVTGLPQSATASYGTVTTVPSPYLSLQQQQAGIVHPGNSLTCFSRPSVIMDDFAYYFLNF